MAFWKRKPSPSDASPRGAGAESSGGSAPASADSSTFLQGDTRQDRETVQVLLDAIARVSESRDLSGLLDHVVDSAIETTGAERGFLVLLNETTGQQQIRVARERGNQPLEEDVKYSTSVVGKVISEEQPMRTTVQSDVQALELGASVFDLKLRAVMCVPLMPKEAAPGGGPTDSQERTVQKGALYVDSKAASREFADSDLALFHALAQHIAIALENAQLSLQAIEKARLEKSLEIATEIQSGLMPQGAPTLPGFDVFGWFKPAEHATGDFYDFVKTRDGRLAVVLGDVTGHGIGPALVTATAQAGLRSYVKVLPDPGSVVTMLNQDLAERMDDGMFLTLFLSLVGEDGRVALVNAGQTPPLLWRAATGEISTVAGTGPAVGMMDDFEYVAGEELQLEPGDVMLGFTDGLVEARHPSRPDDLFGDEGVNQVLREVAASGASARELCEKLVAAVLDFSGGEREDDMTVVAVRKLTDAN